jgi:hypothetical protein
MLAPHNSCGRAWGRVASLPWTIPRASRPRAWMVGFMCVPNLATGESAAASMLVVRAAQAATVRHALRPSLPSILCVFALFVLSGVDR